jgi:hypothetical protein
MSKVTVISERGKLVGTWLPLQQPPTAGAPLTTLVAGPGQKLHQIEVKDAELFHSRAKSDELIKLVKKQLKLK